MDSPTDQGVRTHALDTTQSFIVQAPAGSGKTELLIRRYLSLLARVDSPEQIVAITFTKKAAAEMRQRVLDALESAQGPEPDDENQRVRWRIGRAAWRNDQTRNWRLQSHPARLRIQTVDALCAGLTQQMPWLSGFGAPLQVVEDASELYRLAAVETMQLLASKNQTWRSATAVILRHLDNQVGRMVDLVAESLRYRDQWLRHLGGTDDIEMRRDGLQAAWLATIENVLRVARSAVPEAVKRDLVRCANYAATQFSGTGVNRYQAWLDQEALPAGRAQDLTLWRDIGELLLTRQGGWRRMVNKNHGFPPVKHSPGSEMKTLMLGLLQTLSGDEALLQALIRVRDLPDAKFDSRQWQVLSALARLLPLAAARLQLVFSDTGQVDFSEINLRANQALGALDSPSDLALRLDNQINHLLVDEFQDTSLIQYELLQHLTAGWTPGDGRTLFLVGDPMQSIYRFREAEVSLFLRVQAQGLGMLQPEALTLSVNFRSDQQIVGWANRTFGEIFPTTSEIDRGAVEYIHAEAFIPSLEGAAVEIHPLIDQPAEVEAQRVVSIIQSTWARNAGETIGVLVRSRTALAQILPALDQAGIAYTGVDIEALQGQPVVRDLLTLTSALLYPADRVSWLAILRAPWCGLILNDLYALVAERPKSMCVWETVVAALKQNETESGLSVDGRLRLRRFADVMQTALIGRKYSTLEVWVENTWITLGGPACSDGSGLRNAQTYFDLLADYARNNDAEDLTNFTRVVHQRWAQTHSAGDQRLQVMTLHKAKGLEFDSVIIPDLARQPKRDDARLLLWDERLTEVGSSLLLAPLGEVGGDHDPHYKYLRHLHAAKEHYETLRLLYVGCTRARRCLHLLGTLSTVSNGELSRPSAHSLLHKLWPRIEDSFAHARAQPVASPVQSAGDECERRLRRLAHTWRLPSLPPAVGTGHRTALISGAQHEIEFSWAGETARQVGMIVHRMLECIGADGLAHWGPARIDQLQPLWSGQLKTLGVPVEHMDDAVARIRYALTNVITDEHARWLFDRDHGEARSEYALSMVQSGTVRQLRIDWTFVDQDDTRWIVDFKTSAHEGGDLDQFLDREQLRYQTQLETYAKALAAMEQRPTMLGLYFPLLKGWRQWMYNKAD